MHAALTYYYDHPAEIAAEEQFNEDFEGEKAKALAPRASR